MKHDVEDVFAREATLFVQQDRIKATALGIVQQRMEFGTVGGLRHGQSMDLVPFGNALAFAICEWFDLQSLPFGTMLLPIRRHADVADGRMG